MTADRRFDWLGRAIVGALVGLAVGLLGLVIGLLRFVAAVGSGPSVGARDLAAACLYALGGLGAGVIGGILYPWGRSKRGAAAAGLLCFVPIGAGIMTADRMLDESDEGEVPAVMITGLILGPMIGIAVLHHEQDR